MIPHVQINSNIVTLFVCHSCTVGNSGLQVDIIVDKQPGSVNIMSPQLMSWVSGGGVRISLLAPLCPWQRGAYLLLGDVVVSSSSSVKISFKLLLLQNYSADLFKTLHKDGMDNGPQFYGEIFQLF